jgi:hypothetical protein
MAQGAGAFRPDGEFIVRRTLTTTREFAPGETFDNSSVTERRLRQLYDTRRIIPAEMFDREHRDLRAAGPLTPWRKGEDQSARKPRYRQAARPADEVSPPAPEQEPVVIPIDDAPVPNEIDEVLATANTAHFSAFKRDAAAVLGEDMPEPATKSAIISALQAKRAAGAADGEPA